MSAIANFRKRIVDGERLAGTFLKTPHYIMVEVLANSGLDFICLDGEHAPFDRSSVDQCMALSRSLDFPVLMRIGDTSPKEILWALDCGAVGVVVPHVDSVEVARKVSNAARFGLGGRGYAGSSRWAGYGTNSMKNLLEKSQKETVVIVQIEEPYAVQHAEEIASIEGVDALFAGPADLSVGLGKTDQNSDELKQALREIGQAAKKSNKGYASFIADPQMAGKWHAEYGVNMFYIESDHTWLRNAANNAKKQIMQ